jgi:hypothetical protein
MIYTLEAGDGGLALDLDGMDAADKLWTNGRNVRFENGYLKPFDGHSELYGSPTVAPYGLFPLRTASANLWAYMGLTDAYAVNNAGTHSEITRVSTDYTATADTKWTGGALTSYLIFNNVNDVPQSWNGDTGTKAVDLANWTSTWRCAAIRPLRNYLVAVNITKTSTNYPVMVKWSHAADPGALPTSWNEADATKDAGEQDLGDTNGSLVDLVQLGDLGIVYATDSYHSMQYIGGTYVWRFTKLSSDAGAISQNCVAQFPGGHVVLTSGDVVTHAGGAPTSIINARMRTNLFANIDPTYYKRSFLVHNELRSEVWICIPETSQPRCTKAYVWNYAQNSWGVRDLPNATCGNVGPVVASATGSWATAEGTWGEDSGVWDAASLFAAKRRLVLGSSSPNELYLMDDGITYAGAQALMLVEKTGLALGDSNRIKLVKSVRPRIDAAIGTVVNVRMGGAMTADGTVAWSDPLPYTVGSSIAAYGLVTGRYIGIKLDGYAGEAWRCRSMDIEYEWTGQS